MSKAEVFAILKQMQLVRFVPRWSVGLVPHVLSRVGLMQGISPFRSWGCHSWLVRGFIRFRGVGEGLFFRWF